MARARGEAVLPVVAAWAESRGMWWLASCARVALGGVAIALRLHGSVDAARALLAEAHADVMAVSLQLDRPWCYFACTEQEGILRAVAARCPKLRALRIGDTVKGVGCLRVVRELFPAISEVVVRDLNLECWVYCDADDDRTDVTELTAFMGVDADGSYPVPDQYSNLLLWPTLKYDRFAMPLTPATLDAWVNVLRHRRTLSHVEIPKIYYVGNPYSQEPASTPADHTLRALYQLLEEYPMGTLKVGNEMGDDRARELVDMNLGPAFIPDSSKARRVVLDNLLNHETRTELGEITPDSYPNMTELHLSIFGGTFTSDVAEVYTANQQRLTSFSVVNAWFEEASIKVLLDSAFESPLRQLCVDYLDLMYNDGDYDHTEGVRRLLEAADRSTKLEGLLLGGVPATVANTGRRIGSNGCIVDVKPKLNMGEWPGDTPGDSTDFGEF